MFDLWRKPEISSPSRDTMQDEAGLPQSVEELMFGDPEYLEKVVIGLLIVPFVIVVLWFVSRGWRELAKCYPLTVPFSGQRWYCRSGEIAGAEFGCVLIFGGDLRGVYVSTIFPARLFPPLFIPWDEIKGAEKKGWLVRLVKLEFRQGPREEQWISARLADKLELASGGVWKYRRAKKRVIFGKDKDAKS
jgi:hypothetical protein